MNQIEIAAIMTDVRKGRDGWKAQSYITMGVVQNAAGRGPGERRLSISTSKASRGGISTYASVAIHRDSMMTFEIFGDYSKQVAKLPARCTEKSIRELHATVLDQQATALLAEATAFYAAKEPKAKPASAVDTLLTAIQKCRRFIGAAQIQVMIDNCRGEEGDWFKAKFIELAAHFGTMPKTYENQDENATVHAHYFTGSADWYITEKDAETPEQPGQHQAFGLADLYGDGGELGYISILELIRNGAEFDLHWTPVTLSQLRAKREGKQSGTPTADEEAQALGYKDADDYERHAREGAVLREKENAILVANGFAATSTI